MNEKNKISANNNTDMLIYAVEVEQRDCKFIMKRNFIAATELQIECASYFDYYIIK
ncbi:MAG: hypothetical protein LBQ28_00815 [Prevotellaceae bacterium]|jgi:hypothetical protein|nr:hypothetical protein [Prevotellaceae bacterium]